MTNDGSSATLSLDRTFVPEDSRTFRMARLLLLLSTAQEKGRKISSLDRLAYYEFFADNPWVVVDGDSKVDAADRDTLALAGFSPAQLSYASTGQRFASRRERIRADLAQLIAYGLAELRENTFTITGRGGQVAEELHSSYAAGYRASSEIVLRRLVRLSNKRLNQQVESWIGHSWLLLDLFADIRETALPATKTPKEQD